MSKEKFDCGGVIIDEGNLIFSATWDSRVGVSARLVIGTSSSAGSSFNLLMKSSTGLLFVI